MVPACLDPRRYSARALLLVGIVGVAMFATSYLVEVRVVVLRPAVGDVTPAVRLVWRLLVGLATVGSFGTATYELVRDDASDEGPPIAVEISGTGHDIDVFQDGVVHRGSEPDANQEGGSDSDEGDATDSDPGTSSLSDGREDGPPGGPA